MSQPNDELLIDLLEKRAVYGLSDEEQRQLEELETADDLSFDEAAAAINLAELGVVEEMPANLRARLVADANEFFVGKGQPVPARVDKPVRSGLGGWGWLGWAVAAAACVALIANI